jgi:hypothetical protein
MCLKYVMNFASTFKYYVLLPGALCSLPVKRHTFLCVKKQGGNYAENFGFRCTELIALATGIPEIWSSHYQSTDQIWSSHYQSTDQIMTVLI